MTTLQPIRDALALKSAQRQAAWNARAAAEADAAQLTDEINELKKALAVGKPLEISVTDHALLRYAERVMGFDRVEVVSLIREKVATPAMALGDGKYPVCPGFHAVVVKRVVVTIEPAGGR